MYSSDHYIELFNTLISFYGKIGEIEEAVKIFNQINKKNQDVVSYNALMQAYLIVIWMRKQ